MKIYLLKLFRELRDSMYSHLVCYIFCVFNAQCLLPNYVLHLLLSIVFMCIFSLQVVFSAVIAIALADKFAHTKQLINVSGHHLFIYLLHLYIDFPIESQ